MVPGTFDQCMMQAWAKDPSSKHSFLGIIRKTHRSHPSSVVNYTVNKFPIRSFQLGCRLALAYFSPTPSCLLLVVKVDCERTRGKGPLRHSWHFTEFLVDLRFSCRILHRLVLAPPRKSIAWRYSSFQLELSETVPSTVIGNLTHFLF
jgi:hypothetical protein